MNAGGCRARGLLIEFLRPSPPRTSRRGSPTSAAAYFSSLRQTRRLEVVETNWDPRTREGGWMHVVTGGNDTGPLGKRIVEVALHQERHELREPASG